MAASTGAAALLELPDPFSPPPPLRFATYYQSTMVHERAADGETRNAINVLFCTQL